MKQITRFGMVSLSRQSGRRFCLGIAIGVIALLGRPGTANAQTLTILHSFGATLQDGQAPAVGAPLVTDGTTLYGTTPAGGTNSSHGTIFSVSTNGLDYAVLHQFGTTGDGSIPQDSLTLVGSTLFGTTSQGGTNNSRGTLFAISTTGSDYVILHEFGATGDGWNPSAGLTLVGDTLYGTTRGSSLNNYGTVFSIDTNGLNYTVLYQFGSTIANDGQNAYDALTAVGSRLFGTTYEGGTHMKGTVFAIDTNGANYAILHNFGGTAADGQNPEASLTLVGSTLYGTTFYGGVVGHGTVFSINTNGLGFTNLYQFVVTNYFDAAYPSASLTLLGSTLYGTSYAGGGNGINGTVYAINTNGSGYSILYGFGSAGANDATEPQAALTLVGSTFYGTSRAGGDFGAGTVFEFTIPTNSSAAIITCALAPALATNTVSTAHTVVATVTSNAVVKAGAHVSFSVTAGPNLGQSGTATTTASGQGSFTYIGSATPGSDTIRAISLGATGTATKVWIAAVATHDLAVTKLKAPKKITLTTKKPNVTGKFAVTIQNNGDHAEVIPDLGTLANLVTLNIQSLGTCTNPVAVLTTPKFGFPFNLAPKKKLNLAYTAVFSCANDPLASSKTAPHPDYQTTVTVDLSALGEVDTTAANNVCPRPPSGSDPGCGNKTPAGTLGADVLTDVVVK